MKPLTFVVAAVAAGAAPAAAGSARHVPPAEVVAGAPLEITAEVARAWESTLTLHYRRVDDAAWTTAAFRRADDDAWIAVVPADAVSWPGVEYYIDSAGPDGAAAEFASAERPHRVRIRRTTAEQRRDRDLARVDRRRFRIRADAEYVTFGARGLGPGRGVARDAYYRLDVDWAYRILAYPIEQIRIGYSRMLGDVPRFALDDPATCPPQPAPCEQGVGYKVGVYTELRLGIGDGVDVDARAMAMATSEGFGVGGRAELRFGDEDANHVAVGVEAIQDIGTTGHFRLGWATVPRLPMAATIQLTDMPAVVRAAGVRFVYDVAYPVAAGTRVGGRIGYQARDADVGGLSAGANLTVDF
jgi:hypothetical protein